MAVHPIVWLYAPLGTITTDDDDDNGDDGEDGDDDDVWWCMYKFVFTWAAIGEKQELIKTYAY